MNWGDGSFDDRREFAEMSASALPKGWSGVGKKMRDVPTSWRLNNYQWVHKDKSKQKRDWLVHPDPKLRSSGACTDTLAEKKE